MSDRARPRTSGIAATADLGAKALLLLLLAAALFWPDLSGLKGKASTARLIVYPLGALAIPLWWLVFGRFRRPGFPWAGDLLITLPWLLDLLGNRFNLFDTIGWWDDVMHFVNWTLLTAGVMITFAPGRLSRTTAIFLAMGFGAPAALAWELGEYATFVRRSVELQTAYTDTLGDLTLGTLGSLLAGFVTHRWVSARGRSARPPAR
jgi:hypothetical protein